MKYLVFFLFLALPVHAQAAIKESRNPQDFGIVVGAASALQSESKTVSIQIDNVNYFVVPAEFGIADPNSKQIIVNVYDDSLGESASKTFNLGLKVAAVTGVSRSGESILIKMMRVVNGKPQKSSLTVRYQPESQGEPAALSVK